MFTLVGLRRSTFYFNASNRLNLLPFSPISQTQSRSIYHDNVVDHYENPRNVGSLNKQDINVGTGVVGAPACGDVMKLQIKVDEKNIITNAVFKTFGCGTAIASSSLVTELLIGKNMRTAMNIKNADIAKHLSLPPIKRHCSMLAEDAIRSAINDIKMKKRHKVKINNPIISISK